jgi:hypothetical protein
LLEIVSQRRAANFLIVQVDNRAIRIAVDRHDAIDATAQR